MIEPTDPESIAVLETASEDVIVRWSVRVAALLDRGIERVSAERMALQELQSDNEISGMWDLIDEDVPDTTEGNS